MTITALAAFADNYFWLLHDGRDALVVDPGDARPVQTALQQAGLNLAAILVTHHHADHTGGVAALRDATGAKVFGPARESIPSPYTPVHGGEAVNALAFDWQVLDVPGHTAGHVAYFCPDIEGAPVLFCGDTLFSGGCGRLFEGTPAQMLASLDTLSALPDSTRICCAHEYTLSNLRFARAVEPDNIELARYEQHCIALRQQGQPTLPALLAHERLINPFLRSRKPSVRRAVQAWRPTPADDASIFGALREWKNNF